MKEFKLKLISSIKDRFTVDKDKGEKVLKPNGKPSHIHTINILGMEKCILATLLDPRLKSTPFEGFTHKYNFQALAWKINNFYLFLVIGLANGSCLEEKCPTREFVRQMLLDKTNQLKTPAPEGSTDVVVIVPPTPPNKKPRLSVFGTIKSKVLEAKRPEVNEVDEYLLAELVEDEPLHFWHKNAQKFPNLATLARRILPMPASSGNVERLFSIAGSVKRARRARMETDTLEETLCVRQYLLNEVKVNPEEFEEDLLEASQS